MGVRIPQWSPNFMRMLKVKKSKNVGFMFVDDKSYKTIKGNLERITGTKIVDRPLPQYILDILKEQEK